MSVCLACLFTVFFIFSIFSSAFQILLWIDDVENAAAEDDPHIIDGEKAKQLVQLCLQPTQNGHLLLLSIFVIHLILVSPSPRDDDDDVNDGWPSFSFDVCHEGVGLL